jgi:uncharacterized membrane protein YfcA
VRTSFVIGSFAGLVAGVLVSLLVVAWRYPALVVMVSTVVVATTSFLGSATSARREKRSDPGRIAVHEGVEEFTRRLRNGEHSHS